MKRFLIGILFLLIIPSSSFSQSITTTTCPGVGCQDINVGGQGSIGIQITGTWVGTITFQGSVGNTSGSTFVSLLVAPSTSATPVSTTTGNGVWTAAIAGLNQVRIVFTAWTSGTANITFRITNQARNGIGGTSGGGSGVTSIDLAVPGGFTSSGGPITTSGTLTLGVPTDPNADRIWFWDDSANAFAYLTPGTNLSITGTTINASGGGTPGGSDTQIQFNDSSAFGGDSSFTINKTTDVITTAGSIAFTKNNPAMTNPVTISGGAEGSNASLILNSADNYIPIVITPFTDIFAPGGIEIKYDDPDLNGILELSGNITIRASNGDTGEGGSNITITSGSAATASGSNGGNLTLTAGLGDGVGTAGDVNATGYSVNLTGNVGGVYLESGSLGAVSLSLNDVPGTKLNITTSGFDFQNQPLTGFEITAPAAPAANNFKIYAVDAAGKTSLCARFASGAAQCFATEP